MSLAKIDPELIFEELDGHSLCYKGYKDVLDGVKSLEEITGNGIFKALVTSITSWYIAEILRNEPYWVLCNEAGLHISHGNNLVTDVVVFDKALIKDVFSNKYADVPPRLAIQVDVKIEADHFSDENAYMFRKSEKMLEFGTERVIWILTEDRKIMVMDRSREWSSYEWSEMVPAFDQYQFCLNNLLEEEGVI
ncbi:hypothetical protein SAMN04487996_12730 [Dyadobacter soli]|uniref:Endonuclease, Uma2 family (Restriction endonuclease fold) n=1 Tax=Dyadobacter soli TaxID=659014 RepID=A0A1G7Z0G5_9BACT|nr:hypothetical protein [Dyadobacter soli]SDH02258.1 hypothetical protein SAMN04487996_12730 [Dyadobacter soli]